MTPPATTATLWSNWSRRPGAHAASLPGGDDYSNRVRLFQYDPDADLVIQPEESLEEYSGGGGYASGLSLQGDGMGLRLTEIAGGTGSTDITRVTLQNGSLVREKQWSGRMDAALRS